MRWPLRYQILLPLLCVVLAAILAVSALSAIWADQAARRQIQARLRDIASTLAGAQFPLTEKVLQQARGLSGAELVVVRPDDAPPLASRPSLLAGPLPSNVQPLDRFELEPPLALQGESYFHAAVRIGQPSAGEGEAVLHLLYPSSAWRAARWEAVAPPLLVGGAAIVVSTFLALIIAGRVTRPIRRLQEQLTEIAAGKYVTLPLTGPRDEIRDLAATINRLTEMLSQYEARIRGHERLRTLEQLGGGIAHQLRNAATGCRLALDLHARECPLPSSDENLHVARRQLRLMERYLQRFLARGAPGSSATRENVVASALAEEAVGLVRPLAAHLKTALDLDELPPGLGVLADRDALEQVLVNLLINAVEAATGGRAPRVVLACREAGPGRFRFEVRDNGPGPAVAGDRVFEPFYTNKPDGTGLGLAVAREIVEAHGGSLRWERRDDQTVFIVELPLATPDAELIAVDASASSLKLN